MKDEIKEILSNMLHIIVKYGDEFEELEENEIRYQLPYKQMEKLYDYITDLQQIEKDHQKLNGELREENKRLQEENKRFKNELINKPDIRWECETEDGKKLYIIKSERINMQEELNKSLEEMYKKYEDYKSRI